MMANARNDVTAILALLNISNDLALSRCHYCLLHMQMVIFHISQFQLVHMANAGVSVVVTCTTSLVLHDNLCSPPLQPYL